MNPFEFKTLNREVLPTDSIVDAPSLVTPILIKKRENDFSKLIKEFNLSERKESNEILNSRVENNIITTTNNNQVPESDLQNDDEDDDIQIIKVIDKNASNENSKSTDSNRKTLEDVIRSTTVASLTKSSKSNKNEPILTIKNYFDSTPAKLLFSIGFDRALEVVLQDEVRKMDKKIKKYKSQDVNLIEERLKVQKKYNQIRESNRPYKGEQVFFCSKCSFKSESTIELSAHLEKPHQNYRREFLCNWCNYRIRDPNQIIYHCFIAHKQRCYIEKPALPYSCPFCPFDTKTKKKRWFSHLAICEENFSSKKLLEPQRGDLDYPAITSKFIVRDDVVTYERTLKDIRLASYNPNVLKVPGSEQHKNGYQAIFVVPNQNNSSAIMPLTQFHSHNNHTIVNGPNINHLGSSNNVLGNSLYGQSRTPNQNLPNPSSALLHVLTNRNITQERFSSLQFPRKQNSFANGKLIADNISEVIINKNRDLSKEANTSIINYAEGNSDDISELTPTKNATFVICEICDGYIKDLVELKSHMQSLHKIKLCQKTLESRPPLSCQKCQWRFLTDQGLERHLLGAHGLVTTHMRELVEKNSDSGRCTVCGRAYSSKLVAHMRDVHKSTLKPAHLFYKCTVCLTSFNTYRLFEKHVYATHRDAINRSITSSN